MKYIMKFSHYVRSTFHYCIIPDRSLIKSDGAAVVSDTESQYQTFFRLAFENQTTLSNSIKIIFVESDFIWGEYV